MSAEISRKPIFIHSLYRSGSTYLFNVFRKSSASYFCYQEPEHEFLINLNSNPDALLEVNSEMSDSLRHPRLEKPYFNEFHQIRDKLEGLFLKSFSFDDFFDGAQGVLSGAQNAYFGALIDHAPQRPVLQFCRSSGRIAGLKNEFGGVHLHLWREPRNQWWSFKVNNSFDPAVMIIYNAAAIPAALGQVRDHCQIPEFHGNTVEEEFEFFRQHPLSSEQNYFSFFALWLYSHLEYSTYCDEAISIDRLSRDKPYQSRMEARLGILDIHGLDFSDANIPYTEFAVQEIDCFRHIENQVVDIFLAHGYSREALHKIAEAREELSHVFNDADTAPAQNSLADASKARQIALRMLDNWSNAKAKLGDLTQLILVAEHEQEKLRSDLSAASSLEVELRAHLLESERAVDALGSQLRSTQADLIASMRIAEEHQNQLVTTTTDLAWLRDHMHSRRNETAEALRVAEDRLNELLTERVENERLAEKLVLLENGSAKNLLTSQAQLEALRESQADNERLAEQLQRIDNEKANAHRLSEVRLDELLAAKVETTRLEEQARHARNNETKAYEFAKERLNDLLSLKIANARLEERVQRAEMDIHDLKELNSKLHSDARRFEEERRELHAGSNKLQKDIDAAVQQREDLDRYLVVKEEALRTSMTELHNVYASKSWRITRPLRRLAMLMGKRNDKQPA